MSEINETKRQLHKASYFFNESVSSLELAQEDGKKVHGLVKKMGDILLEMQLRRSSALETAQHNMVYVEEAYNQVGLALDILWPGEGETPVIDQLSAPLLRAHQHTERLERILEYTVRVLAKEAPYATRQTIDAQTGIARTLDHSTQAGQHLAEAAVACNEHIKIL